MNDFERWLENGRWVPDFVKDVLLQYDKGIPVIEIAKNHNITAYVVKRIIEEARGNGYNGNTKQN